MTELTGKSREAWEEYLGGLGYSASEIEKALSKGVPIESIELGPGRSWGLTKYGGYSEVPEDLVRREIERIGLPPGGELPKVVISREKVARIHKEKEGPPTIFIPRRLSKKRLPGTLRHELAHYNLEKLDRPQDWIELVKDELLVDRKVGQPLGTSALIDCIFNRVAKDHLTWKDAIYITKEAALSVGVPKYIVRRAIRWVRNYMDRYGL